MYVVSRLQLIEDTDKNKAQRCILERVVCVAYGDVVLVHSLSLLASSLLPFDNRTFVNAHTTD